MVPAYPHPVVLAASLHSVFNYAEAAFWWTFALVFFVRATRGERRWRRDQVILALGFAGFGLSDWIEVGTGAWWRPWWLLVLKGVCLLIILRWLWKLWPELGSSASGRTSDRKESQEQSNATEPQRKADVDE